MSELRKASLHITGIVQGVGFRPFIYSLAARYHLNGWVRNTSAGVDIEVDGTKETLDEFITDLRTELPPLSRVDTLEIIFSAPARFTGFEIINSEAVAGAFQPISPDVCICPDCLHELLDPGNRRYHYPFINCTNCGPRFTIITDIPYDRPNTTMARFKMCPDCTAEYRNPYDRRFHAQPVACPICGPKIWLEAAGRQQAEGEDAIREAKQLLADGKIIAIKGLGGFHLACDATNPRAVDELRRRKLRVDKPFAVMMPDLAIVQQNCVVTSLERGLLESRQRPIVLLERKLDCAIVEGIAPGQHRLGVMLPYTPLHYLLFTADGSPFTALVMTSGNLSEEPIATENAEARERLSGLADAFLMHDRDILIRCDDSVVQQFENKIYHLRRSRGYAPDSVQLPFEVPPVLATGPELKNTFCLTRGRYAFPSQHIGDMENYETLRSFEEGIQHFERLFRIQPEAIGYDLHPNYLSTRYAMDRAKHENLPAFGVQHHHAHIAACMADNGLNGDHAIIGVAFDGTGYGDDGAIWGGEFLVADYTAYQRAFHLAYFPLPGGDAGIKSPARTALALLWTLGLEWEDLLPPCRALGDEERMSLRNQIESGLNTVQTSSLGRLFDATAALVGIRQLVNYEAQAAIEFESVLDESESRGYHFEIQNGIMDPKPVITSLLVDIHSGVSVPILSARFHNGVAEMVREVCGRVKQETGLNEIALSGGVWQNMTLLKRTVHGLRKDGFTVLVHNQVPTNDGGLSLGQAMVTANRFSSGVK
jgi:hydrogenase maturation protein HypF